MTELEGQFSLLIAIFNNNNEKNGAQISETGNFFPPSLELSKKYMRCVRSITTSPPPFKKLVTEIEMRLFSRNNRRPIITCKQFTKCL